MHLNAAVKVTSEDESLWSHAHSIDGLTLVDSVRTDVAPVNGVNTTNPVWEKLR